MFRSIALLAASVLVLPMAVAAQEAATLSGTVEDTSGGALPGVTVTAVDNNTGRQSVAVTDGEGGFRMSALPPGAYRVEATLSGFANMLIPELELLVGQNAEHHHPDGARGRRGDDHRHRGLAPWWTCCHRK